MTIRRRLRLAAAVTAAAGVALVALTGCATADGGAREVVPYADPPGFRDGPPWGLPAPGLTGDSADPRFVADGDAETAGGVPSPPAVADIHIEQPITLADGSERTCVIEFSVLPDGATPNNGDAVRQATVALTSTDWTALLAAPPNPAVVPVPSLSGDGLSEEQLRANELAARIPAALFALGLPSGWTLYGQNECH